MVPMDEDIKSIDTIFKTQNLNIDIKHLENTYISFVVIDRKHVFISETEDNSKENSFEAISRMAYTSSPSSVSFYNSIFESFWDESKLHEKTQRISPNPSRNNSNERLCK